MLSLLTSHRREIFHLAAAPTTTTTTIATAATTIITIAIAGCRLREYVYTYKKKITSNLL